MATTGYESIVVSSAVKTLTASQLSNAGGQNPRFAHITVWDTNASNANEIHMRWDGTNVADTAGGGSVYVHGDIVVLRDGEMQNFTAIRENGAADDIRINIHYTTDAPII